MSTRIVKSNVPAAKCPFLFLGVRILGPKAGSKGRLKVDTFWSADVDGRVGRFFHQRSMRPTELLLELCRNIEKGSSGRRRVISYGKYSGPSGPTHIFRNGVLFERMCWEECDRRSPDFIRRKFILPKHFSPSKKGAKPKF